MTKKPLFAGIAMKKDNFPFTNWCLVSMRSALPAQKADG